MVWFPLKQIQTDSKQVNLNYTNHASTQTVKHQTQMFDNSAFKNQKK